MFSLHLVRDVLVTRELYRTVVDFTVFCNFRPQTGYVALVWTVGFLDVLSWPLWLLAYAFPLPNLQRRDSELV